MGLKEQVGDSLKRLLVSHKPVITVRIPVVLACDNNYAQHLAVTISSILKNKNKNEKFDFYIVNSDLLLKNKEKLLKLKKEKDCNISFIEIDKETFKECPLTVDCPHISITTYYRYLLSDLFKDIDKILYLDCDLVVTSSLSELYNTNIEDYYFAGVADILSHKIVSRLGLKKYCNAGVMLINLKKWRENNISNKLFEWTFNNLDKIQYQDQDVINVVMQDGIKYLPREWNNQVGMEQHFYDYGYNESAKNAKIIHFIGGTKPWHISCVSAGWWLYFKYLFFTEWRLFILKYFVLRYLQKLFSIRNQGNHKVICLFGIKIKIKRKK